MIMIMRKMVSLVTVHELRRLYLDKEMMIMLVRMTIIMMLPCVLSIGKPSKKKHPFLGFAKIGGTRAKNLLKFGCQFIVEIAATILDLQ